MTDDKRNYKWKLGQTNNTGKFTLLWSGGKSIFDILFEMENVKLMNTGFLFLIHKHFLLIHNFDLLKVIYRCKCLQCPLQIELTLYRFSKQECFAL